MKHILLYFIAILPSTIFGEEKKWEMYPGLEISLERFERATIKIYEDQIIYVTNGVERALIRFDFSEKGATYQFKSINRFGENTSGKGKLFEKYIETKKANGNVYVKNDGGQLIVHAGKLSFEWSPLSKKSAYIYFYPHKIKVYVLSSSFYDKRLFFSKRDIGVKSNIESKIECNTDKP